MELLTYAEAADLAEISVKTIQRHVLKGKLSTIETPFGKRIPREALGPYLDLIRPVQTAQHTQNKPLSDIQDQGQTAGDTQVETQPGRSGQSQSPSDSVPLAAHLAALELAGTQLNRMSEQLDQERRRVEVAERARFALEAQLSQYQRALAENAETLAEARAKVLESEAKTLAETQVRTREVEAKDAQVKALEAETKAAKAAPKSLWSRFRRAFQGQAKTG